MDLSIKKKTNLIGWAILLLYTVLYIWVTYYHEPWFDEAQAWEIAKCGSYRDLLFLIPHGEGHPPLWSLILSIPAKLGVPYEIGIKSVAYIFSIATAYLIIFKAPFAKWVRYTLPFTYFFFYQYGVISRTYCVVMFLIMLIAVYFKTKDEHPYGFMILLALLCTSSAYGIVIAGGISICWCIDIWKEKRNAEKINIKLLIADKRVGALLVLLVIAAVLMVEILPYKNTVAVNPSRYADIAKKIVYMFFAMQGEAFASSTFPEFWEKMGALEFLPGILATVISWIYLCINIPKKTWKYYFIPETLFAMLMTFYGYQHHTGICVLIYIGVLWGCGDFEGGKAQNKIDANCHVSEEIRRIFNKVIKAVPILTMGIMLLFTAMSAQKEIDYQYADGRSIANFIKEHNMEDALIMAQWNMYFDLQDDEDDENREYGIEDYDSNYVGTAVPIVPYFDKNIFFNHNDGFNHVGYVTHFAASMEDNYNAYSRWKAQGYPEVLIDRPSIELVYGDELSYSDYQEVFKTQRCPIWKGSYEYYVTRVYVRKDCLEKYDLD